MKQFRGCLQINVNNIIWYLRVNVYNLRGYTRRHTNRYKYYLQKKVDDKRSTTTNAKMYNLRPQLNPVNYCHQSAYTLSEKELFQPQSIPIYNTEG